MNATPFAGTTCLVGHTGFVGSALMRRRHFSRTFNSTNIDDLPGTPCDLLVCCAAPATMWIANENPAADKANLARIADRIGSSGAARVVLISTIAVFDDAGAGYTESNARYQTATAYGRHRRELEEALADRFDACHVLRLPALFGRGLRKNFLFDLINPVPSFLRPAAYREAMAGLGEAAGAAAGFYAERPDIGMWALDRAALDASPLRATVQQAFERIGLTARGFTNSASRFQFYNVERLADDIETAIARDIRVLNICSEPLEAAQVCYELTGETYRNDGPARVVEDVRSDHAGLFGRDDRYLYDRQTVLAELKAFHTEETA